MSKHHYPHTPALCDGDQLCGCCDKVLDDLGFCVACEEIVKGYQAFGPAEYEPWGSQADYLYDLGKDAA